MKHTYSINFNNLSERAKESIEYYLLLNERKNGESSLKDDLERDLEIANTQKPSQDKERAAWIDRLTGQIVLEDNEEEEGRKIVQKIIKTYSQDHTYIIPNLIGCGCVGDNIEGPFLFDAQPEMVASKKRYYMYESKLMFEHTVKGISITPMIPVNYAGHHLTTFDKTIVPVEITVIFDTKNPKETFKVQVKNDISLSNGKSLIKTILTEESPKILRISANLVADKYICEQLIDEYIKHIEKGSNRKKQKNIKIDIAYNAKAALLGKDFSYEDTDEKTRVAYSTTKNQTSDEKISCFKAIIETNKDDLSKDTNKKALTAIIRLLKRFIEPVSNQDMSTSPLNSSVGFFKSHGETLVELVSKKTALPSGS